MDVIRVTDKDERRILRDAYNSILSVVNRSRKEKKLNKRKVKERKLNKVKVKVLVLKEENKERQA